MQRKVRQVSCWKVCEHEIEGMKAMVNSTSNYTWTITYDLSSFSTKVLFCEGKKKN